jgi:hypothetical protein
MKSTLALPHPREWRATTTAATVVCGVCAGIAAVLAPLAMIAVIVLVVGVLSLRLPAAAWVAGSIALVLFVRVPISLGALPEAAVQLPLLTAWIGFGLAVYRRGNLGEGPAGIFTALFALLISAIAAAALASEASLLRPLLTLALLGTPFALIGAILLEPPSPAWRRRLIALTLVLLAIQIPVTLAQTAVHGIGDFVTGTLTGSLIGAHQIPAITIIGALWLALNRPQRRRTWVGIALLAVIPILSAANQVILVLPATLLIAALACGVRFRAGPIVAFGGVFALLLLLPGWNSEYARTQLGKLDELVKAEPAEVIAADMTSSGRLLLFGRGPAQTVSGAAFFTVENDQVRSLGIEPAELPEKLDTFYEVSSVRRPISSILGIAGDLGMLGTIAYGMLFAFVFNRTRRTATPLGQTSTAALVLWMFLGFVNDGLEQPAFAMFTALLVGLTLTAPVQRIRENT